MQAIRLGVMDLGVAMHCPKCKAEHRAGLSVCGICGAALAPSLESDPVDYIEILATHNPVDMAFLKSLLDSEGIQYVFKGEHYKSAGPGADPVRLMVRSDQVGDVLELIKDLKLCFLDVHLDQ